MKKAFFIKAFIFFSLTGFAQKATISGYVTDKTTGENLFNCGIFIKELNKTAYTNDYGFYSFTVDTG
ncbi:MAG TPA: hypothetical protein VD905_06020, partial [Flavobacteriales bacterium]|nr:hypothetical protein [Flavobacteriales bacterium]